MINKSNLTGSNNRGVGGRTMASAAPAVAADPGDGTTANYLASTVMPSIHGPPPHRPAATSAAGLSPRVRGGVDALYDCLRADVGGTPTTRAPGFRIAPALPPHRTDAAAASH